MTEVVLAPEGDVTCLRFMAHLEAGDQVIFEGNLTEQPWWPAVGDEVLDLIERRNGWRD